MGGGLGHKLNKKLRLVSMSTKNSRIGDEKRQISTKNEKSFERKKRVVKFNSDDRERSESELYGEGKYKRRISTKNEKSFEGKKRVVKFNRDDREGSESEVYGEGKYKPANFNRKRKRIYGEEDVDWKLANKSLNSKALSRKGRNGVTYDSVVGKKNSGPSRSIWVSSKIKASDSKRKHPFQKVKLAADRALTSHSKRSTYSGQSQGKLQEQFRLISGKKTVKTKKSVTDDSEVLEDKPKKRKRIRLDPYDVSNKRLDDGLVENGTAKEKEKELDKDVEMSKNAQFRAIKPSHSILSFVEDNLLGRRRTIELKRAGYNIDLSAPLDNIPGSSSAERERIEESIFRNKLTFFAAAKVSSSLPPPDLPEIAFAGRSNVGKSSLLNSLTRQWGVARTSDKPGLTQSINFFNLGPKLCLVDLPGYGFAYAKEEVKDAWEELVKEYVATRAALKRVCLLIDTKWGMKPRDHELINIMERAQTKYQIVLTKTDLVFPIDLARRAMQIEESLKENKSMVQPVMMVSSKSGAGIRSLRTVLGKIARFVKA